VRVTAESGDDLAHITGLVHQRLVYRLKGSGRFRRYLFAKPDEQIDALKVIRAFAMAKGLTVDDPVPGRAERCIVAVGEPLHRQRQCGRVLRESPRRAAPQRA